MSVTAITSIGGKGSRLKSTSNGLPKGLLKINEKTVLYRIAEQLSLNGINNLLLLMGYKSELFDLEILKIEKELNIKVSFFIEKNPLGECGGLWQIIDRIFTEDILFVCGDIVFDMDLKRFIAFHKRLKSNFSLVSHISTHPEDSDLIRTPNGCQISKFKFKNEENNNDFKGFLGNAGISIFKKDILLKIKPLKNIKDVTIFRNLAYEYFNNSGRIFSYNTSEYIKDMGTPERLKKVIADDKNFIIEKRSYKKKQNCLFIDRDNTLIKCEKGKYILDTKNVYLRLEKISKLVEIRKNYDLCIMVTNQPQISMGIISFEELYDINCLIIVELLKFNFKVDEVVFCPHHPHKGFDNEIIELKMDCFCRKPNPGMIIHQAILKNIDLSNSLMIGDSNEDLYAASNAGLEFINIEDI